MALMVFVGCVHYQRIPDDHPDHYHEHFKGGARKKLIAAAAAVTPEQWKKAEEAKCLRWGQPNADT